MSFSDIIVKILSTYNKPLTPREIKDIVKRDYPAFYGTAAHIRNVNSGNYSDKDHALLAQIYNTTKNRRLFFRDRKSRPMKIYLNSKTTLAKLLSGHLGRKNHISLHSSTFSQELRAKAEYILKNLENFHAAFYNAGIFGGPSLYFHQRALATRNIGEFKIHLEYVYATLASWGMHRMGKSGSKMQSYGAFIKSILAIEDKIHSAQRIDFERIDDNGWLLLKDIFQSLNIMATKTALVGNSKAMHHMLPNIVPPIDREYTLHFLVGGKDIKNDLEYEWGLMRKIIGDFYIPVAKDMRFKMTSQIWLARQDEFPWDTSAVKIIDNLIIGSRKV